MCTLQKQSSEQSCRGYCGQVKRWVLYRLQTFEESPVIHSPPGLSQIARQLSEAEVVGYRQPERDIVKPFQPLP